MRGFFYIFTGATLLALSAAAVSLILPSDSGNDLKGQEYPAGPGSPGNRARTVQIWAGQYGGDGAGGQNSNTNLTLGSQSFKLAETGVEIKNAFVVLETQLNGSADRGNTTGHLLSFDACLASCTPAPWSGSGRVEQNQGTTVLQYQDATGGHYVRLLMNVTAETQLAAYSGASAVMNFDVGYRFNNATTAATIDSVKARLFITYIWDDTSESYTNTVIYPLESTEDGARGSRLTGTASSCTRDSDCSTFTYNLNLAEVSSASQRVSQWFEVGGANIGNLTTDIQRNVNIQGTDVDSGNFFHEAAQGGSQGSWNEAWWSGVSGFAENTDQTLEHFHSGQVMQVLGGETFETYVASSSAATKTRTVSFPMGVVVNDLTSTLTDHFAGASVYFAETGVTIKKAWLRIFMSGEENTSVYNVTVATKVGNNATSSSRTFEIIAATTVIAQTQKIYYVIPSSDYAELAAATATSGKDVWLQIQSSNADVEGISAELLITYTYRGEFGGYLTTLQVFAGQSTNAGNSQSQTLSAVTSSVLPETVGTKTMRAAALRASYAASDSDGAFPSAAGTYDANISTGSPSCSNAYASDADAANAFHEFLKLVTGGMNTTDNQSYSTCYSNSGHGDTSAGAKMNGYLIYTYQLTIPTITVSGRAYQSNETTALGAGKTVALRVNGVLAGTGDGGTGLDDTDANSDWLFEAVQAVAGDTLTIYLTGETEKANTVTITDGTNNVSGAPLYDAHVVLRSDNGSSALTINAMRFYDRDNNSADLFFTANTGSPDTLNVEAGYQLYITAGDTFAPGGHVTVGSGGLNIYGVFDTSVSNYNLITASTTLQNSGTLSANGSQVTLNGTTGVLFTRLGSGVFNAGTSEVLFNPNASVTLTAGSFTGSNSFYKLSLRPTSLTASHDYLLNTAALETGSDLTINPASLIGTPVLTVSLGDAVTVASTATTTITRTSGVSSPLAVLDTTASGHTLATGHLDIKTGGTLKANGSNIIMKGDWTRTGTFTQDSSTVRFIGSGGQTVFSSNTFYNLVASTTAARAVTFTAGTTQTIASGGSAILEGVAGQLLTLQSSEVAGTKWNFAIPVGSARTVNYTAAIDVEATDDAVEATNSTCTRTVNWTCLEAPPAGEEYFLLLES